MFSFFHKKRFLVDLLHGFVDIHNHILPGIDDGAKTVEESIALIKAFSEFGVNNFVCTPHIMHNYYDNTPETITHSFQQLKNEMAAQGIMDVALDVAAEHMIDDNFEEILVQNRVMPLRKHYLLIETSFLQPPINFEQAKNKILAQGYFPILAHPERYLFFHNNFQAYKRLKNQNILFQVNLLSLTGYYGKEIKSMAIKLMDKGLVDFLGSDVHTISQLKVLKNCNLPDNLLKKINTLLVNTIEHFR